jgi:hypothetical protein
LLRCQSWKYLIGARCREWKRSGGWAYGFILHGASFGVAEVDAGTIVL